MIVLCSMHFVNLHWLQISTVAIGIAIHLVQHVGGFSRLVPSHEGFVNVHHQAYKSNSCLIINSLGQIRLLHPSMCIKLNID